MDIPGTQDADAVRQALTRLMAIADRLETRHMQTVQQVETAIAAMDHGVSRLDAGGEHFARNALQMIGGSAQQVLTEGAGQALGEFRQQLLQSANSAKSTAHAMDEQCKGLANARRTLVWNGLIALTIGSLLAVGAAAWVAHRSMQEVAQARFGQDILQATQRGVLTRCGDSLCARIGSKPHRYGKDGRYLLLQE